MDVFHLLLGFVLLFLGGKYLVYGGVGLASFFKIPTLVVGLTVVALGTSAPELLVSLKAALSGHPDIAMGNVVGSNISNIALVLGITALIFPIPVMRKLVRVDWPVMMFVGVLLYFFVQNGTLLQWQGLVFLAILVVYNVISIKQGRTIGVEEVPDGPESLKWYWALVIVAISAVALVFGADFLVNGASSIARNLGVSERVISVSIIAFGTSVPELSTSVIAALKKETDISIGNIIGSNIFNIAAILGTTSSVTPVPVSQSTISTDMVWMLGISVLLLLVMVGRNKQISRIGGIVLLLAYCLYIYFLLNSGA